MFILVKDIVNNCQVWYTLQVFVWRNTNYTNMPCDSGAIDSNSLNFPNQYLFQGSYGSFCLILLLRGINDSNTLISLPTLTILKTKQLRARSRGVFYHGWISLGSCVIFVKISFSLPLEGQLHSFCLSYLLLHTCA